MPMIDVLVIGAGIIGCASALALAKRGAKVRVLEQRVPGAGASSAAAGVLAAQDTHGPGPLLRLCTESLALFPNWVNELKDLTGIDVEYRRCGTTSVAFDADELNPLLDDFAWLERAGYRVEVLDAAGVRAAEPAVVEGTAGGVRCIDDARIDPPSLVKAVHLAAERQGVEFQPGSVARRVAVEGDRTRGVVLESGTLVEAASVLVTAGSWSSLIGSTTLPDGAVRPARGQIVELVTQKPVLSGIVIGTRCYLSPRDDGRILVGSTLEFVGFRPGVTAGAVRDLLAAAIALVPSLESAEVGRTWSGFRPYTKDELPLIGATAIRGLFLATGHFRNGVLLAPVTGEIVASLMTDTTVPIDITAFAATRLIPLQ
jgi:glycine oxidase